MRISPARDPNAALNRALGGLLALCLLPCAAYEFANTGEFTADAALNARLGLRQGYDINFGYGALPEFAALGQTTGETERTDLEVALRPSVTASYKLPKDELYGGLLVVGATTTLDGELSGQFARAGDRILNTDSAYVGWRHGVFDLSYGAQPFHLGDGFVVGDGNFNQGHDNGQYWIGAFEAWRNTAVLKINTAPLRADVFWLRTDQDLGDARVAGINLENSDVEPWGRVSTSYFEIFDDEGGVGNAGMQVWSLRGGDLHLPSLPQAKLYVEFVQEFGRSERSGIENAADAWYVEPTYQFAAWPWAPRFYYRYARYSGDEATSADNEEYRGLFFTLGKRDWDTWYQGEINGEFFLFNENQITQMLKVKAYPNAKCAVVAMVYHHALEEPQYFGLPTTSTAWSDEVNLEFEFYPNERLYGMAVIAWGTPNAAAKQLFGNDDQVVLGLFLSYTLN
ncbi:MAG: hypothetical protein EXR86_13320 [Gammaproteobacteria bacterium]|nr:hypothetical protein [Gammaproteobacteria bacterium]